MVEQEPGDMAWRLDPETDLVLNLHLQPSGRAEQIQPSVGLYFTKTSPTRFPMLLQLEHDGAIDIPPNTADFTVTDHLKLPVDVDLLKIYPHAHYLGKRVEAWADFPDGTRRALIEIKDWDINWQAVYTYREPVHLPKGTTVGMRIRYDNTAGNIRNPNHPPERVRNGDRSRDEMGHVWLQVVAANREPDPRVALQEAVMRRRLEKYPADVTAHYNLGALYQARNRYAEAVEQYCAALRTDPELSPARNVLGAALLAEGRNEEGIAELRETVRRDSAYAAAYLNLGAIYIALEKFDVALPFYRRACELAPDANTLTDLGTLYARTGNLPAAVKAFRRALELDPANRIARKNLERAAASR